MIDSFQNLQVNSYPEITSLTFSNIHKSYLKVVLFNIFILFGTLYGCFFIVDYLNFFNKISEYTYLFNIAFFIVFLLIILFKYIGFKKRQYAVREKDISYKSGILFKRLITVPFNRVQHIEVDEGPISRYFGLASLSVYTAGDSSDDLEIKGLLKSEALKIKEFISTKIDE